MELSIIIVNYNTAKLLENCLFSVKGALSFGELEKKSEIIVVDNASTDGSVSVVKRKFPEVLLLQNRKNLGYAKGNNQGIRKTKGKYLLLLNSDTQLKKESLINLLSFARRKESIGVVGGKLFNLDGSFQPSFGSFPHLSKIFFWMTFLDDLPFFSYFFLPYHAQKGILYRKEKEVDWVSGAFFLVSQRAIRKAGLLDEKIFMYGEEVEWCYRIKKAGFSVYFFPKAQAYHHKSASSSQKYPGILEEFKAIEYFYHKHKSSWQKWLMKFFLKLGALLRVLVFGIMERHPEQVSLYAKAFKLVG